MPMPKAWSTMSARKRSRHSNGIFSANEATVEALAVAKWTSAAGDLEPWLRMPAWACVLALALLLSAAFGSSRAEAVATSCSITSSGVAFSPYDTVSKAAVDGLGTISVTCSGKGSDTLNLSLVGGNSGSCSSRVMKNGSAALGYQIYQDSSRTTAWCDGANRLELTFDFSLDESQTKNVTMYGRVGAGQNPSYGSYSDTLTLILRRGGGTLATGTAAISGSVAATCALSTSTLGFGTYSPSTNLDSSAVITVNCSSGSAYSVSVDGGQNLSGGFRRLAGPGGSFLNYQLFKDAARTSAWGDGTGLGAKLDGTGNGSNQSLPVYGRIPASQNVRAGSYSDVVQVTVEY